MLLTSAMQLDWLVFYVRILDKIRSSMKDSKDSKIKTTEFRYYANKSLH